MDSTSDSSSSSKVDHTEQPRSFRSIAVSTLFAMAIVTLVTVALAALFRDLLLGYSKLFVNVLGGPGVALGFFVPDAFTVPLPNDAFSAFGWLGGMPFYEVLLWASLGSLSGGSFGWWFGKTVLHRSKFVRRFFERRGIAQPSSFARGSKMLLAMAALTPLPYSLACWSAGAVRMPFATFFSISLLRILRISVYLWLIIQGFVTVVGENSL